MRVVILNAMRTFALWLVFLLRQSNIGAAAIELEIIKVDHESSGAPSEASSLETLVEVELRWESREANATDQEENPSSEGSTLIDGDNPYQRGCLHAKSLTQQIRVCGSEDPPSAPMQGICRPAPFGYKEIRLYAGDWDSSVLEVWILQIILSEILHVPTSLELGDPASALNFYHPDSPMDYNSNYSGYLESFETAHVLNGDCSKANHEKGGSYQQCGHFLPETWSGESKQVQDLVYDEVLEPPQALNLLGQQGWYIPRFTAEKEPSLLSYLGMQGQANREKLARHFRRPTSWKAYCDDISPNNCSTPDEHAERAPTTSEESDHMYKEGLYKGYFRSTAKNNCQANPFTCTGYMLQYPCTWRSPVPNQLHYLNISLDSDVERGGHTFSQMVEIWRAAKANEEDVVVFWWSPESLIGEMRGTDAEFTPVSLPLPTRACLENKADPGQHCLENLQDRLGSPSAVCGEPPKILSSLMSTSLFTLSHHGQSEAEVSPAHAALKNFKLTELQLDEIISSWHQSGDARETICEWVSANKDYVESIVPRSYPRTPVPEETTSTLTHVSSILGGIVLLLVLVTMFLVHRNRTKRAIQYAQIEFLALLLLGSLLIALGAIIMVVPSSHTCVAQVWLLNMGYTLELVPLIVKVAAVNYVSNSGKAMRRTKIRREFLFRVVAIISILVIVFLILRTVLDPPKLEHEYELTESLNNNGETIVHVVDICGSNSLVWTYISVGWSGFLLLCTTILAIQMRKVQIEAFRETTTLALLVYSHLVFVVLRTITHLLFSDGFSQYSLTRVQSMLFSLDTAATIAIYFVPKFLAPEERKGGVTISGINGPTPLPQPATAEPSPPISHQQQETKEATPPFSRRRILISGISGISAYDVSRRIRHAMLESFTSVAFSEELCHGNNGQEVDPSPLKEEMEALQKRNNELEEEIVGLKQILAKSESSCKDR